MIIKRIINYLYCLKLRHSLRKCGNNLRIGSGGIISSPNMIEIGDNVAIGPHVVLYSIYKKIIMGNNVVLGPNVTMVSGDHNIRKVGVPIIDNHEKEPSDDEDIIIGDDVWIGANVTVLKGVEIGRGCVIGAGALLVKSIPAYCIAGGVPAKIIGVRFKVDEILAHEKILYKASERMHREDLCHIENFFKEKNA